MQIKNIFRAKFMYIQRRIGLSRVRKKDNQSSQNDYMLRAKTRKHSLYLNSAVISWTFLRKRVAQFRSILLVILLKYLFFAMFLLFHCIDIEKTNKRSIDWVDLFNAIWAYLCDNLKKLRKKSDGAKLHALSSKNDLNRCNKQLWSL